MSISYLICAAGEGTRFQADLPGVPKALIRLYGHTLLEWSLRSLPIMAEDKLIMVTQVKHRLKEKANTLLQQAYPFNHIEWLELPKLTSGQLETAVCAEVFVNKDDQLVIYNCDTYFQCPDMSSLFADKTVDGVIPCARAEGTSWSFCKVDDKNQILDVREKERISSWASVGLYYFRDSQLFFKLAKEALAKPSANSEYYVAPLYQEYITRSKKLRLAEVTLFKPMGTPEQIEKYWGVKMQQVKSEQARPVLVVDLDNTLTVEESGVPYPEKKPNLAVIEKLKEFKRAGYEIIIYSSRQMATWQNDESKVVAKIGEITLKWLHQHEVPFDGLKFGKPYARNGFYVDDKAIRPDEFLRLKVGL